MSKPKRFETVYQESTMLTEKTIFVDKETGVNYLYMRMASAAG